ncbi:MAG: 2-C-methyl-D-erythritol 4-phosphate cytidylyltransferase [Nitrospinae bacterium]|nr:2-C-methyl-D-erythritol 4-phosphate cytidylyltransferase [Nitrospinota bacterium]
MIVTAIIPAAGTGNRMGGKIQKQFLNLYNKPIIAHTLLKFQMCEIVNNVYLIVPPDKIEHCKNDIVLRYKLTKVVDVLEGGKERQDSVYNGFKKVDPNTDIIVIHDGVRPFVTEEIIRESIHAVKEYGVVVAAVPEKDTIKEVSEDFKVGKTLNRRLLWRIQTPQVFKREILERAFKRAIEDGYYGTDEASLAERAGYPVRVVWGSDFNIKITTPEELIIGTAILNYMNLSTQSKLKGT